MQGVLALPVEPHTAIRSGPEPWLIRLDDAASEMHYAAALIETWLRGGLEVGGRHTRIGAGLICAVLSQHHCRARGSDFTHYIDLPFLGRPSLRDSTSWRMRECHIADLFEHSSGN